ncbi:MAG TPA: methyltransferase domain-containing protein [Bacillales bacterium]|nr:methyltransferase domain-containing protein [Bacillales bacterium]
MVQTVNDFQHAESCLKKGEEPAAEKIYLQCICNEDYGPLAYYRLGEIYNRRGEIDKALQAHKNAFRRDRQLARRLTNSDHPNHDYVFETTTDTKVERCTLCGTEGKGHSVYNLMTDIGFVAGFNPVRLWMYCDDCHHLFAGNRPSDLGGVLSASNPGHYQSPRQQYFSIMSDILNKISLHAEGTDFLEIGVGAGEMIAVAKEMDFNVTGIEIRPSYARSVSEIFDIDVRAVGFEEFQSEINYDVICMGDVIEHVIDPIQTLKKAAGLLKKRGILWISTPNFESAVARALKDQNPMWRTTQHLNYFSYASLKRVLHQLGFQPLNYQVSNRYVGSMEIIAKKSD